MCSAVVNKTSATVYIRLDQSQNYYKSKIPTDIHSVAVSHSWHYRVACNHMQDVTQQQQQQQQQQQ